MPSRAPAIPIAHAIAHALGVGAILGTVAMLWLWWPGAPDSILALVTVAATGGLAWAGATVAADVAPPSSAANDNHPFDPCFLAWSPIDDTEATVARLSR